MAAAPPRSLRSRTGIDRSKDSVFDSVVVEIYPCRTTTMATA